MILRTAGFLCVIYAEICVNVTPHGVRANEGRMGQFTELYAGFHRTTAGGEDARGHGAHDRHSGGVCCGLYRAGGGTDDLLQEQACPSAEQGEMCRRE